MTYGVIYRIKNLLNGKEYYGQTTRKNPNDRFFNHCAKARKSAISLAIQKYGVANFKFEVMCSAQNKDDLNILEIEFIKNEKSMSPNGYNLDPGGNNAPKTRESIEKGNIKRRLKTFPERRRGVIAAHSETGHIIEVEIVKDFLSYGFTKNDLSNIRWVLTGKGTKKRVKKYFFKYKNHANQRLIVETKETTAPQRTGHETAIAE